MAKKRIYELARDLNMTNKLLLDKLSALDISVKSHMSSLDDDTVAKVKVAIFGKKEETIEETRIKPTIIRRRKKTVKIEVAPEPSSEPLHVTDVEKILAEEEPTEGVPNTDVAVAVDCRTRHPTIEPTGRIGALLPKPYRAILIYREFIPAHTTAPRLRGHRMHRDDRFAVSQVSIYESSHDLVAL